MIFDVLGREDGCLRLSRAFYARVAVDPLLKPLFPGKSLRCATEEFAAFLVEFFGGDESRTQRRWWLSLRESHARFRIDEIQRSAWLANMSATLSELVSGESERAALSDFFTNASLYVVGHEADLPNDAELAELWRRHLQLEDLAEKVATSQDRAAMSLADAFSDRPSLFVGILARMMATGREELVAYAVEAVKRNPKLIEARYNGRPLLHFAAGSACLPVVQAILSLGGDPNILDSGGHAALYRAAGSRGPSCEAVICALVEAGADVNHAGGVTRSTPLHEAARHGNLAAGKALLALGADPSIRDKRNLTPLDRATNCRRKEVAELLRRRLRSPI